MIASIVDIAARGNVMRKACALYTMQMHENGELGTRKSYTRERVCTRVSTFTFQHYCPCLHSTALTRIKHNQVAFYSIYMYTYTAGAAVFVLDINAIASLQNSHRSIAISL